MDRQAGRLPISGQAGGRTLLGSRTNGALQSLSTIKWLSEQGMEGGCIARAGSGCKPQWIKSDHHGTEYRQRLGRTAGLVSMAPF